MSQQNITVNRNTYDKITLEKRVKLVEQVQKSQISVAKAARRIGIKISTAKLILKKYREEGTFFEKIKDKMQRIRAQNHETRVQNQNRISAVFNEGAIQTLPNMSNYVVAIQNSSFIYMVPDYQLQFQPSPLYFPQWNYFN